MAGTKEIAQENGKKGGRPKGSTTRPQIRDYFTKEEIEEFVTDLKESAENDPAMKRWLGEQIFGKAPQPISGDDDGSPIVVKIVKYGDKPST